jgi:hypothetical protein
VVLAALIVGLASVLGALMLHTPIRRHHLFLLLPALIVPTSAALGASIQGLLSMKHGIRTQRILGFTLCAGTVWFLTAVPGLARTVYGRRASAIADRQQTPVRQAGIRFLREHTPPGSVVICDDPMLPFKAARSIPPAMAAPSYKRVEAGDLSASEMIRLTQQVAPSALVFWEGRMERVPGYLDWVRKHYVARRAWNDGRRIYTPMPRLDPGAEQPARSYDGLEFLGSHIRDYAVQAGGELVLDLYWHAFAEVDQDYVMFVHLLDEKGNRWGAHDLMPLDDVLLTSHWLPGDTVAQQVVITVGHDAPSGEKLLSVGMYGANQDRVDLLDGQGRPLPDGQVILTPRPVVRWQAHLDRPNPRLALTADLGDKIRLVGYVIPSTVESGQSAELTLYWHCLKRMRTRYTVFVHVLDAQGQLVAQSDQIPGQGAYPTTGWLPGEYLTDTHRIALPSELPSGGLSVQVGLYNVVTGQRLPVRIDQALPPEAAIALPDALMVDR